MGLMNGLMGNAGKIDPAAVQAILSHFVAG